MRLTCVTLVIKLLRDICVVILSQGDEKRAGEVERVSKYRADTNLESEGGAQPGEIPLICLGGECRHAGLAVAGCLDGDNACPSSDLPVVNVCWRATVSRRRDGVWLAVSR